MKATITVKMDNEAFTDAPGYELARILRECATLVADGGYGHELTAKLRDINGNTVGEVKIRR
jgi:hypothetical protein